MKLHLHPRVERGGERSRRDWVPGTLLLLVGTPGTGKRPIGHYLADHRGYVHLDFEDSATRARFLGRTDEDLKAQLAALSTGARGIVITWGAGPVEQLGDLRRLRSLGLEPIWFDSDRGAACSAHYADATRAPRFRFVDSFDRDGRFRPVEDVVEELLAPQGQPRPAPVRGLAHAARGLVVPPVRIPVHRLAGSLGARIAGGLALVAATATATVTLLSAVGNPGVVHPTRGDGIAPVRAANAAAVSVRALPQRGVLVAGQSLAGVKLGDSMATVRALWGGHFSRCGGCKPALWFYIYPPPDDPVGAGVQFSRGKVVAVFTLGGPAGWHTNSGIRVGQILDNPLPASNDRSTWLSCAGYSAKATRTGADAVTSILTQGSAVYGFALTRPSVSPCQ